MGHSVINYMNDDIFLQFTSVVRNYVTLICVYYMYLLHCFISACLLSSPLHHKYGIHVIVCVMLSVCWCHVVSILCCLLCYVHWEQSNSWSPGPCMCTHTWSKPNLILNKHSVIVLQSSELLKMYLWPQYFIQASLRV